MFSSVSSVINDEMFLAVEGFGHGLFLKLEALNPAGSVKLKTACGLIEDAFARGLVNEDTVFIESSSGNLGVALAMVCAERRLNFTCVIDPNCSIHNENIIRAFGAEVVKVHEKDINGGYLGTRLAYIRQKLTEEPQLLWLNQYQNLANPKAHSGQTAFSIARNFEQIDYLFVGAGTTGTLMGCLDYFRRNRPHTRIVAVDSVGSITFGQPSAPRHIPGLGSSERPPIFDPSGLYAAEMVSEARTVLMCRHLARQYGMLVGGSTGTVLAGVHAWRDRIAASANVVAISPDWGDRYLATVYDDDWARAHFGDDVLDGDLTKMAGLQTHTLGFADCAQGIARNDVSETQVQPDEPRDDRQSIIHAGARFESTSKDKAMSHGNPPSFSLHIVGGEAVANILADSLRDCIKEVEKTYLDHESGLTNNPDSYFLRFPNAPSNRIIALPATIDADGGLSGIKWISSFPGNLARGIQRASAVLVLNDAETGYPFALLEASRISAARTAASAVLAAFWLNLRSRQAKRISFVGGGIIARAILDMFVVDGWTAERMGICDLDDATTHEFIHRASTLHGLEFSPEALETALDADVVVLVTTASEPYITDHDFRPGQTILNISLRDIAPQIIHRSNNILDDVEHCLKANTSPDLAARKYGNRDFINGTLAQVIAGKVAVDPSLPTIFSPFGLGVLDLALGRRIFNEALRRGTAQPIDNFLFEMGR